MLHIGTDQSEASLPTTGLPARRYLIGLPGATREGAATPVWPVSA